MHIVLCGRLARLAVPTAALAVAVGTGKTPALAARDDGLSRQSYSFTTHAKLFESGLASQTAVPEMDITVVRSSSDCSLRERCDSFQSHLEERLWSPLQANPPAAPDMRFLCNGPKDLIKIHALTKLGNEIHTRGYMPSGEALRFAELQFEHLATGLRDPELSSLGMSVMSTWGADQAALRREILARLPILQLPFRAPGQTGRNPSVWIPNPCGLRDADLALVLGPTRQLIEMVSSQAAAGSLSAESFALLKKAVASCDSPMVDYIAVKAGGVDFARTLGISTYRAEQVVQRYDQLCQVTLPAMMLEAEGNVIHRLATKAGKSDGEVRAAAAKAILREFRKLVGVHGVLKETRQATHEKLATTYPELVDALREIVIANSSNDILYKKGETPVDQLLLQQSVRGQGGQLDRFTRALNVVAADRGIKLSPTGTKALMEVCGPGS